MRFVHTTRCVTAGAALGLSGAVSTGAAFTATAGSAGYAAAPQRTAGSLPTFAAATAATATTSATTAPPPGGNTSAGTQTWVGTSPMMSEMLTGLSHEARGEFQTLYPQMIQLMDSSHMMSGTGTGGSVMDQPATGNGPASIQQPAS